VPSPAPSYDPPDFTERVLRRFLLLCESPRTQRRALALVRGSVGNARLGRRFYALVNRAVLNPVARAMGLETSAVRVELVGAQLIGLAMLRYVLEVEPIASMDIDDLVPLMAPSLRATMSGRTGPEKACDCRPELITPSLVMPPW
jgi:Tetracyclin repressor-like, C-terminal domain